MSIQFPASKSLCNDLAKASEALDGKKHHPSVVVFVFGLLGFVSVCVLCVCFVVFCVVFFFVFWLLCFALRPGDACDSTQDYVTVLHQFTFEAFPPQAAYARFN